MITVDPDDFQLLLAAAEVARQLATIASDWNLNEVEIDGKMVPTYILKQSFFTIINHIEEKYNRKPDLTDFHGEYNEHS